MKGEGEGQQKKWDEPVTDEGKIVALRDNDRPKQEDVKGHKDDDEEEEDEDDENEEEEEEEEDNDETVDQGEGMEVEEIATSRCKESAKKAEEPSAVDRSEETAMVNDITPAMLSPILSCSSKKPRDDYEAAVEQLRRGGIGRSVPPLIRSRRRSLFWGGAHFVQEDPEKTALVVSIVFQRCVKHPIP